MNLTLMPSDKIFSVTEINSLIKDMLEGAFPQLTIEGEISNYRPNSTGHLYFTLKDSTNQISAVMFRGYANYLNFKIQDGMKVQCTGKLTVYGAQGKYQINVTKMSVAGEGAILKMLEDRKRKLAAEGLFDQAKKKPLPLFPKTIGIVTSPTGAALRDILQITKRRNKCVSVVVLPAVVQGSDAAQTIARQIYTANRAALCDVLIVGRGGGSLEDLLPFSEEIVVRAIASSAIPVVSAVGHEIVAGHMDCVWLSGGRVGFLCHKNAPNRHYGGYGQAYGNPVPYHCRLLCCFGLLRCPQVGAPLHSGLVAAYHCGTGDWCVGLWLVCDGDCRTFLCYGHCSGFCL